MPRYQRTEKAVRFGGGNGMTRSYTRHVLYRDDEADYDGDMHETSREIRPLAGLYEDPFAEAGYSDLLEDPVLIQQFRSDVQSREMRDIVQRNRIGRSELMLRQREAQQVRTRADLLRAVEQSRQQQALLDTAYAHSIPAAQRDAFLAVPEVEHVCAVLVPMMLAHAAGFFTHLTETQLDRVMRAAGCESCSAETRSLPGHINDHRPPPGQDFTLYRNSQVAEHAHYDEANEATPMRVLTYTLPPDKYAVTVVSHVVATPTAGSDAGDRVLCFRTFHFGRPRQSFVGANTNQV